MIPVSDAAVLAEVRAIRAQLRQAIALLQQIAGDLETGPPVRTPTSFHLSVSGPTHE